MLAISYADKKLSPSQKIELTETIKFITDKLNSGDYLVSIHSYREYLNFEYPFYHNDHIYGITILDLPCVNVFKIVHELRQEFKEYKLEFNCWDTKQVSIIPKN